MSLPRAAHRTDSFRLRCRESVNLAATSDVMPAIVFVWREVR